MALKRQRIFRRGKRVFELDDPRKRTKSAKEGDLDGERWEVRGGRHDRNCALAVKGGRTDI